MPDYQLPLYDASSVTVMWYHVTCVTTATINTTQQIRWKHAFSLSPFIPEPYSTLPQLCSDGFYTFLVKCSWTSVHNISLRLPFSCYVNKDINNKTTTTLPLTSAGLGGYFQSQYCDIPITAIFGVISWTLLHQMPVFGFGCIFWSI